MQSLAKLTPPKLTNVHRRGRLFEALDARRSSPAVWIIGPPGAGKTTLIASYVSERKLKPVWYRMDEGDADPATLFYYLRIAAKNAAPRRKAPLPLFTPEYLKGLPAFARRYFREFYERLPRPAAVVFDNYQDVGAETPVHEVMQHALAEVPEEVTVIIASRTEPPHELARLRANDLLQVVKPEELRLDIEESKAIAASRRANLNEEELKLLNDQTQGWAAGLTLLCELGGAPARQHKPQDDAQLQSVFDYFAGEIFDSADRHTRDFLMETAFLPWVSAGMAEQLTAHRDAGDILYALAAKNYFTLRAGDSYHYHPLFREFLMARARDNFSDSRLDALRSDAAKLLSEAGAVDEAADLWLQAGNWRAISELVASHAQGILEKGRNRTLENWLGTIPAAIFEDNPWLLYWRATGMLPFKPARSQPWFERAFHLFEAESNRAGMMLSWAGITRAIRYKPNSDVAQFDHWVAVMRAMLDREASFPSQNIEYHVAEGMVRAMHWRMRSDPNYARWKERLIALANDIPDIERRTHTLYLAATYELLDGSFAEARMHIESAAKYDLTQLSHYVQNFAYMVLAYYQRETGQFEETLRTVERGLALTAESGVSVWNFHLCGHGIQGAMGAGKSDVAEKLLARMIAYQNVDVPGEGSWYHYLASWLAARKGDLSVARMHAQMLIDLASDWYFFQGMAHAAMGSVLLELSDYQGARIHAEELLRIGCQINSHRLTYGAHLMRAGVGLSEGDTKLGVEALAEAFALGRDRGYAGVVWWHRGSAAKLCAAALKAGIETDYVREIIRIHKLAPPSTNIENWPWPLKVTTLGGFAVLKDDHAITFSRKAPKKVISLLKAIIAFGGTAVPERKLIDALWPDEEGDAAREALGVSLHRLRKLLDDPEAVQVQEAKISLDPRKVWVDMWSFERLLASANGSMDKREITEQALRLYRGAFLPEDSDESWTVSCRERLRGKFVRHSSDLGRHFSESGQLERALDCYLHGLEADDLAEELYQGVMRCYQQMDRRAEGLAVYRRMRQTLSVTLGIKPSASSEALYRSLSAE